VTLGTWASCPSLGRRTWSSASLGRAGSIALDPASWARSVVVRLEPIPSLSRSPGSCRLGC
jgi:hypothetical protein